jgi:hypothetical protein
MARSDPRTKSPRSDVNAGRAVALSLEALGDALQRAATLPARFEPHASALAQGRSVVPADGERTDFPARVKAAQAVLAPEGPAALAAWLGDDLAAWVAGELSRVPGGALAEAVRAATDARDDLLTRKQPVADVFERWHGEGLDERAKAAFKAASEVALGEAVDRWVALGCEGDLDRVVATWQRSSAGWAERTLGTAVDVSVGDLGNLRSLQLAVRGVKAKTPDELPRAVARRMGLPVAEVERLLALDATVRERRDPKRVIRRRWALVKPIAVAVADLEKELGRMPSVTEIAERASVHPCAVDLVLEAMGEGDGGDEG